MTKRRLLVIGVGAGDPELMTLQAIAAINAVDVFLVIDKGDAGRDLADHRAEILRRFATERPHRIVHIDDTRRRADVPYTEAVGGWHRRRVAALEAALLNEVGEGESAGMLVWGDPALYDSTLRIIDQVNDEGIVTIDHEVVPGISSVALLAARHRITTNRIGEPVQITTGRQLASGLPSGVEDVVVMLDANNSFTTLLGQQYEIFWGAYLGTANEILLSGRLDDIADEIIRVRAAARERLGWMFDTYLLRRLPIA